MQNTITLSLNREAVKDIDFISQTFDPEPGIDVKIKKPGSTVVGGAVDSIPSIIDISVSLLPISAWASIWFEYLPKKIYAILQHYSSKGMEGFITIYRSDQGYEYFISNNECFVRAENGEMHGFISYKELFDYMQSLDKEVKDKTSFLPMMECIVQMKVPNGMLKDILLGIIDFFSTIVNWIYTSNLWIWKVVSKVMLYLVLLVLWYALNCAVLPMGGLDYTFFGITECPQQNAGELLWQGIFTFLITFAGIYGVFYANEKKQIKDILYYAVLLCVVLFLYMLIGFCLKMIDKVGYGYDLLEPFFVLIVRYLFIQTGWILLLVIGRGLTKIVEIVWESYHRNVEKNIIEKDF